MGNGHPREECLSEHLFTNYNNARQIIGDWRIDYNNTRPHSCPGGLTLMEFVTQSKQGHN